MNLSKKIVILFVVLFAIGGLFFRLKGISDSHSFWSDEAYIASVSRDLYEGKTSIFALPTVLGAKYQLLHVLITSGMFMFLGATETAARIPSVVFSSIAIVIAYFVAKGFSNKTGGLVASFLMAFSQVQLVYATQSRPYAALTATILGILYCLQLLTTTKNARSRLRLHILTIFLCIVSCLLHTTGVFFLCIYFSYLVYTYQKQIATFVVANKLISAAILTIGSFLSYFIFFYLYPPSWFRSGVNNITYFRELFAKEYLFLSLPAVFGIVLTYKKYPGTILGIVLWIVPFLFAWNFIHYSHSVRYLLPFFSVLYVFFGVFWGTIFSTFFKKLDLFFGLCLIGLLFAGGDKIVRKPAVYYNPNEDLIGNVQNANFKEAYAQLHKKIPNVTEIAILNDIADTQRWYLPEKPHPDVYLMRSAKETKKDTEGNITLTKSLDDFILLIHTYPRGILIVEDWHSILPEEIKEYAKKNMKREIRVEGLPQANGDNWPIEIYSWGI